MRRLKKTVNWLFLLIGLIFTQTAFSQIDSTLWTYNFDDSVVCTLDSNYTDWFGWNEDCDTIVVSSIDDLENLYLSDYINCYIIEYADSFDWDFPIDSFDWGYPVDTFDWNGWDYSDCDTILISSFDDLENLYLSDYIDCYIIEYADSFDWDFPIDSFDWGYPVDTFDWNGWDYSDCDTVLISSWDDFYDLDFTDYNQCYFYEYADSFDWDFPVDTLDWNGWDYADCDTVLISSWDDFYDLDFTDYNQCYFYEYADSFDWDFPIDTLDWNGWDYADCDTVLISSWDDFYDLDYTDYNQCYFYEYADSFDWDFPVDTLDWYGWDYADCDTVLISSWDDFEDLDFTDYNQCYIYEYTDSFDWDYPLDSIDWYDWDNYYGYNDSIDWYGYGNYDSLDCDYLLTLGIDCDDIYNVDTTVWSGGFWEGYYGDCGVDGSIIVDSGFNYDYSNATITIVDEYGNTVATINADADGNFNFNGLSMGNYTLVVEFAGFEFEIEDFEFSGTGEVINGLVIENREGEATSIDNIDNNMITVYPNPAVNFINVNLNALQTNATNILITNTDGRIVRNINGSNNSIVNIDVNDLVTGSYIITITTENKRINKSFIKTK